MGSVEARDSPSVTSDLVRRFADEVWNERNLDGIEELIAEAYELRNLSDGTVTVRGREQLREHVSGWLAAFPDLRLREVEHIAQDQRVACVMRITGTHSGVDFHELPPRGATIDVALVAIFDGDGERLVRHATLVDARGLLEQLAPRAAAVAAPKS